MSRDTNPPYCVVTSFVAAYIADIGYMCMYIDSLAHPISPRKRNGEKNSHGDNIIVMYIYVQLIQEPLFSHALPTDDR